MDDREVVILASLLHDLGKFAQRAGNRLSPADRSIEGDCCPQWHGRSSHTHVLHSGKWIRDFLGEAYNRVELLVLFHHRPETCVWPYLAKIVTVADRLSSGEREARPETEADVKVSEILLTSLFTKLSQFQGQLQDFPMVQLTPDLRASWGPGPYQPQYARLWEGFAQECKSLDFTAGFDVIFSQCLALLEKYTLFMPAAAYRDRPDIPLFHHLKATAALAACIYDLGKEEKFLDELLSQLKTAKTGIGALSCQDFLLIAGDISGIQNFIYSITSEKALKGLKGRSLYLELLARAVAEQILQELRLPSANLLFLGGGHFYLLAPKTDATGAAVEGWQERVNRVLVQAHGPRLALVLHQEPVAYQQFLRGPEGFADVWRRAATQLAREKRRKFASCWQDQTILGAILGPQAAMTEEQACGICGEEIAPGAGEKICPACQSFAELASQAAGAQFLETAFHPPQPLQGQFSSYRQIFQALGIAFSWHRESDSLRPHRCLRLNSLDLTTKNGPCRGFVFLAHHVPRRAGEVKTLEDLAAEAQGLKKWGLLRADVDNLGKVFSAGLGDEDRSLSRVSALSQLLSLFFSGHVQHLISTEPTYKNSIYLVYAGGDDLCLLGPWSVLPDLARRLREEFGFWTRGSLTLSAGLYLAPRDKFPVYQAAEAAGELLETAKRSSPAKDCLGIFHQAVRWRDIPALADIKDLLFDLLEHHGVPRALLALLKASWQEQEQHERGALPMYRVWNLLYGMRRLTERLSREKKDQAISLLKALEQKLIVHHNLRAHTDIAVRWAEYLTRKED